MARARTRNVLGAALLGLALGCSHTHTTDAQQAEQELPKAKAPDTSAHHAVPIATAPEGLLKSGAEDEIRDKLVAGGFMERHDGSVHGGLLRFQRAHDLPATGDPDAATLRKLGLDPDKLLRKSSGGGR
jgi:hypothetical protein